MQLKKLFPYCIWWKMGFILGLIFPGIVHPYSLKTPTYLISLENIEIYPHFFLWIASVLTHESLFIYFVKRFKLINHINEEFIKLNKEKINQLLNSEAVNYLETSERLVLKNILEKVVRYLFFQRLLLKIYKQKTIKLAQYMTLRIRK